MIHNPAYIEYIRVFCAVGVMLSAAGLLSLGVIWLVVWVNK